VHAMMRSDLAKSSRGKSTSEVSAIVVAGTRSRLDLLLDARRPGIAWGSNGLLLLSAKLEPGVDLSAAMAPKLTGVVPR
jgi:hypothetical protein